MKHLDFAPKAKTTRGSKIYTENNNILIDGVSSWWTACHGYNHPHIINSIIAVTRNASYNVWGFTHAPEKISFKVSKMVQ